MRHILGWIAVALCCVASAAAGEERPDARRQQAIARAEQSLAKQEAALGKEHLALADALDTLGRLYEAQGVYPEDDPGGWLRSRELARNLNQRAASQNFYHLFIRSQGTSARAARLYERALSIREAALGENHPEVTRSLYQLAEHYRVHGAYGRAEFNYLRAFSRREKALGENHVAVAESLDGLGQLATAQGFLQGAEIGLLRALAIREAALGKRHPDVAASLHHLGNVYLEQGKYSQAEPLYQRALAMVEATRGKNHPQTAEVLDSLGVLFMLQGLYAQAEPLYSRALTLQEAALGKAHPETARVLTHRALLYAYQEQYARAEPLLERALALQETALGKHHPQVATTLRHLARLRLVQQRLEAAPPLLARALDISEARLRVDALISSESRLANTLGQLRGEEELIYSLLSASPDSVEVRRLALTTVLLRKGRSAVELASISRSSNGRLGAPVRGTLEQLSGLRTQLTALSLPGRGGPELAGQPQRLEELTWESEALETHLARSSALERAYQGLPPPDEIIDRVTQGLPRDGALVEFIAYTQSPFLPRPRPPGPEQPEPAYYLALVLFPNGDTRAVELGPAEPVDRAVSLLRDALARRDANFQASAQALYRLAFRPLLPLLGDTRRLFLSPDGELGLVPFAALHDGRRFLADRFDLTYLTSGRDLMPRLDEQLTSVSSSIVVLADPDFSASRPGASSAPLSRPQAGLGEQPWIPLPGTRREAEAIQRLFSQARLFLGAEASKERLFGLSPPGVLHLATHGFFLDEAPAPEASRAVGHFGAMGERVLTRLPPEPLLHSGLVLASTAQAQGDSALATALELAGLNLWGTQLVVLSACDTGRGVVKRGQGIYGLRRALILAGAETVVMSLWKVNDDTTGQLMEAYYRNLREGQGRAIALRKAMSALRASHPHPHYWAPFIVLGRDTPLRGLEPGPPEAPKP